MMAVGVRGCMQDGASPIYVAAYNGHKECIEVLAGLGGDVNKAETVSVKGTAQLAHGGVQHVQLDVRVLRVDVFPVPVAVCRMGSHPCSLQRRTATRSVLRCWQVWVAM